MCISITVAVLILTAVALYLFPRKRQPQSMIPEFRSSPFMECNMLTRIFYFKSRHYVNPLCILLQFACGLCKLFEKEKIGRIWIANRPFVLIFKPETAEVVLSSKTVAEKTREYQWLTTGIFSSKGKKWRNQRKLMTATFHALNLENFLPIFNEQSQILVSHLKTLSCKTWVDIVPLITDCTLDVLCQILLGVKVNVQGGSCVELKKAASEIKEIFIHRVVTPWLWFDTVFNLFPCGRRYKRNFRLFHSITQKVLEDKKRKMLDMCANNMNVDSDHSPTKRRGQPLLELLLEHHLSNKSLTEEDIRNEVATFMFAGHDTTTMTVSWTLHSLGLYQDIQENVLKEIDLIFEDDLDRPVSSNDIKEMIYLECVIKETLRLYSSVPLAARELKEDTKVLDYTIPAGNVCVINFLMLHRDPKNFPEPEKFRPERFLPENSVGRHPCAYIPFAAGLRNCIAQKFAVMQGKVILANILRNFRIESLDHRDKVNVFSDIVIRNADPVLMRFINRHNHIVDND